MIRERRPLARFFAGIWYKLSLRRRDGVAPYHSVLATAALESVDTIAA